MLTLPELVEARGLWDAAITEAVPMVVGIAADDRAAAMGVAQTVGESLWANHTELTATLANDDLAGKYFHKPLEPARLDGPPMKWGDLGVALVDGGDATVRELFRDVVMGAERATMYQAVKADSRTRYRRIPSRADACAWCWMMASRDHGRAYLSKGTVISAYHDFCRCSPVLVSPRFGTWPEGADNRKYVDAYYKAREDADSGDPYVILAKMREQNGLSH